LCVGGLDVALVVCLERLAELHFLCVTSGMQELGFVPDGLLGYGGGFVGFTGLAFAPGVLDEMTALRVMKVIWDGLALEVVEPATMPLDVLLNVLVLRL
jgi:hypothetical protein